MDPPLFNNPIVRSKYLVDIVLIGTGAVVIFAVASYFDLLERVASHAQAHENWEIDELVVVAVFLVLALAWFSWRRFREAKRLNRSLAEHSDRLDKMIREVKELRGILPICASCKRIRDSEGHWQPVESYIRQHSDAEFSHGLCSECAKKLYPDFLNGQTDPV